MHSNSRAAQYRDMVEDVIVGGLLEEDEIMELHDLLKRVERRMKGQLPERERASASAEADSAGETGLPETVPGLA